jgi:hypothetical protein
MADPTITGMAFAGMIVALVLRGILPYLLKRKEAEETGRPIPSFSTSYMTTFIISIITGVMGIMVTVNELELKLEGITSLMSAAAIGFTFSYSALSLTNTLVDLKTDKIAFKSFLSKSSPELQQQFLKQQQETKSSS